MKNIGSNPTRRFVAKDLPPNTTFNVAGGQWVPASVNHKDETQFEKNPRNAFKMHEAKGSAYDVSERLNNERTNCRVSLTCRRPLCRRPRHCFIFGSRC